MNNGFNLGFLRYHTFKCSLQRLDSCLFVFLNYSAQKSISVNIHIRIYAFIRYWNPVIKVQGK